MDYSNRSLEYIDDNAGQAPVQKCVAGAQVYDQQLLDSYVTLEGNIYQEAEDLVLYFPLVKYRRVQ